jgi:alpha-L-fucosidase
MADIGEWMKVFGEAIYGTTASPFEKLPWGRCTQKKLADGKTRLYLHVFDWPADGKLVVPLVVNGRAEAVLLTTGEQQKVTVAPQQVTVHVPQQAANSIATVIALDIEGTPNTAKAAE